MITIEDDDDYDDDDDDRDNLAELTQGTAASKSKPSNGKQHIASLYLRRGDDLQLVVFDEARRGVLHLHVPVLLSAGSQRAGHGLVRRLQRAVHVALDDALLGDHAPGSPIGVHRVLGDGVLVTDTSWSRGAEEV